MLNELNSSIKNYNVKWKSLLKDRADRDFFKQLKPIALGWKTVDQVDFDARFLELRNLSDHVHLGWVNERWIATFRLKQPLYWNIKVVKLMQLRPSSTDSTGLDHVDFYVPNIESAMKVVNSESNLKWTHETSNVYVDWLSIWFNHTEAKLRTKSVLEVCIDELKYSNQSVMKEIL